VDDQRLASAEVGRREEALAAIREAVTVRRRLAQADPGRHLPDLAMSFYNLSLLLSQLGRRQEARDAKQEVVRIRRQLAQGNRKSWKRHRPSRG
jgi:hypothetical protein